MKFKKDDEVYVNYMDGVMLVKILKVRRDGYEVKINGNNFLMGFNEVSKVAQVLIGVPPIRRASSSEG